MAIKPLTDQRLAASGILERLKGKTFAFVPVTGKSFDAPAWCLGIAVQDEPGYKEIPWAWVHADTYDEMCMEANRLNLEKLSLGDLAADVIIVSTMSDG